MKAAWPPPAPTSTPCTPGTSTATIFLSHAVAFTPHSFTCPKLSAAVAARRRMREDDCTQMGTV